MLDIAWIIISYVGLRITMFKSYVYEVLEIYRFFWKSRKHTWNHENAPDDDFKCEQFINMPRCHFQFNN